MDQPRRIEEAKFDPKANVDDDSKDPELHQFKVVLIGDAGVGKSSLARRFQEDTYVHRVFSLPVGPATWSKWSGFQSDFRQTIGADFLLKKVFLGDQLEVSLQVWDIGGQTLASKMLDTFLFGAHAVVLVYDMSSYDTFQDLDDWLRRVRKIERDEGVEPPMVALVGNKMDLIHLRAVRAASHSAFCEENEVGVDANLSAKSGLNVDAFFFKLCAALVGTEFSSLEIERNARSIPAVIVHHTQDDEASDEKTDGLRRHQKCVIC